MSLSENTTTKLKVGTLWALVGTVFGATVSIVGMRDKALADIRTEIRTAVAEERTARKDDLARYVTREELLVILDTRFERLENRLISRLGKGR